MIRAIGIAAVLLLVGCGGGSGGSGGGGPSEPSVRALAQSDINGLSDTWVQEDGYLGRYERAYKSIFGGYTGANLQNYFGERIHFETELSSIEMPDDSSNGKWTNDPHGVQSFDSKAEVGAANVGTQLWYQGLIDQKAISVKVDGRVVNVTSPRTGIMVFGPGYKYSVTVKNRYGENRTFVIPAAYRQGILLHEARHSDCTGGLTTKDLEIARRAKNSRDFTETFPALKCGHLHIYCPRGHQYEDLPACDNHPWGAYAVQAVFEKVRIDRTSNEIDRIIMETAAADAMSRLQLDTDNMIDGKFGPPDMSNNDVVRNSLDQ